MQDGKDRNWCFTCWDTNELNNILKDDKSHYVIYGEEICPNTNKLHYQGYAEFDNKVSIGNKGHLKKIAKTTHWERRYSTQKQAIDYCKKDGKWFERGQPSHQGERTDIMELKECIDKGAKLSEVADQHFEYFLKFNKGILMYMNLKPKVRTWKTECQIMVGPPGCGKSIKCPTQNAFWLNRPTNSNIWWDGYNGEEDVVLDDFYSWVPFDLLLRILDRYPLNVEIKGGVVPFLAKRVWITSNQRINEWYSIEIRSNSDRWNALLRRIEYYIDLFPGSENNIGGEYCPQISTDQKSLK